VRKLTLVIVLINTLAQALVGCGRSSSSGLLSSEQTMAHWRSVAPTCSGYPSKANCDDGDMTLFGGLICAGGESRGCDLVRDAQGPEGQWWRSPRRVGGNLGEPNSFSRDMAMGVLLYLETTRDTGAAERWINWIHANRSCSVRGPRGNCLVPGVHRFCRDDKDYRCLMTPGNWAMMGRVWDYLGLPRSKEMRVYSGSDDLVLPAQAEHTPVGYQLHLLGVEALLKKRLGPSTTAVAKATDKLIERQPDNPFFDYLAHGGSPELAAKVEALCPKPDGDDAPTARNQWSWERDTNEQAWRNSMGWDCLFLGRLVGDK